MDTGTNGHRTASGAHLAAPIDDLAERARQRLLEAPAVPADADERAALLARTARAIVDQFQKEQNEAGLEMLDPPAKQHLVETLTARLDGSADLRALLADNTVRDIWCQGWDTVWVLRVDGTVERAAPFTRSDAELVALVRELIARSGPERRFDRSSPLVDLQLEDGSRLHAVGWVSKRVSLSIRKRRRQFMTLDDLEASAMFDDGLRGFLAAAVRARCNMIISGPTGAGKTTLLRALCSLLPVEERLLTIEDVFELGLDEDPGHGNVVALQARGANLEGKGAIGLDRLYIEGLRMNPDRAMVGEARGDEAVSMLRSMSQGDKGSLSTLHAETTDAALDMLILLCMSAERPMWATTAARLIGRALDLVIGLDFGPDRRGHIASVREVTGANGDMVVSNELWEPGTDRRARFALAPTRGLAGRLEAAGWQGPTWSRP